MHACALLWCLLVRRQDLSDAGFLGLLLTCNTYGITGKWHAAARLCVLLFVRPAAP